MSILLYGLSSKREKKIIGNATTKATLTVLANLVEVTGWPDQNRESDHDGQIYLKIGKEAEKNRAQNYERYCNGFLKAIMNHVLHVQNLEENNPKG